MQLAAYWQGDCYARTVCCNNSRRIVKCKVAQIVLPTKSSITEADSEVALRKRLATRDMAGSPTLLASVAACDVDSIANGSLRQQLQQLGRLGHRQMQLVLSGQSEPWQQPHGAVNSVLIQALGVLYDTVAEVEPRAYVVPLVPCAGYTTEDICRLPGIVAVAYSQPQNSTTSMGHPGVQQIILPPADNPPKPEHIHLPHFIPGDQTQSASSSSVSGQGPLQASSALSQQGVQGLTFAYNHVAVGGTFDRLHCGHELLLATTALVAKKTVYVGITADKLLASKNHRELLQSYAQRESAAVSFMKAVRPELHVEAGALSDPKEPTAAELDPAMEAIVVSQETLPGAIKINEGRAVRGYNLLDIIVVPVIGGLEKGASSKLSSTQLRAQDAAALLAHQPA